VTGGELAAAMQRNASAAMVNVAARRKRTALQAVAQLTAHLEEQDSKIQKVNAQLKASKPTPQVVANNH